CRAAPRSLFARSQSRTRSSSAISPHFSMKRYVILPVCTCSLIISLLARGQDLTPANAFAGLTYNLTISPTEAWVDTRIDLHPGDALQINAVASTGGCSPNGAKTPQNDTLPLNS